MLIYKETPVQEVIGHPSVVKAGVRLLVKREDLNHPAVSGNKWWKLKYNLEAALTAGQKIITFGGAYSNHIYATAAACAELKLASIGIIRGEQTLPLNATLQYVIDHGMEIHYVTRAAYREKSTTRFVEELNERFGEFFLIPEGGTNTLAIKGCAEFAERMLLKIGFDHLLFPVGTGGTMAGLLCGFKNTRNIIGVPVLKENEFLTATVRRMAMEYSGQDYDRYSFLTDYHHGGYAKFTPQLLSFIQEMENNYQLPLDPVYTGKMLWAVLREIEAGAFAKGSTLLLLHTGGLQAVAHGKN